MQREAALCAKVCLHLRLRRSRAAAAYSHTPPAAYATKESGGGHEVEGAGPMVHFVDEYRTLVHYLFYALSTPLAECGQPSAAAAAAAATSPRGFAATPPAIFQPRLTSHKHESYAINIPQQVCDSSTNTSHLTRRLTFRISAAGAARRFATFKNVRSARARSHAAQPHASHAPPLSSTRTCTLLRSRCARDVYRNPKQKKP
jgi:hypothetical protein